MKAKPIFMIFLLFASIFVTGCMNNEMEDMRVEKNDPDTKVRNAVIEYMEEEDWNPDFYTINKWEQATVSKTTAEEKYNNLDQSYMGKEIFVVTIADALAAPLIFVDPETMEVIGIMPGE